MEKETEGRLEARRKALAEHLRDGYGDGVVMLDGPEFDGGIVGVAGGRLVYSYAKLVESLSEANGWSGEEAAEWIEFNTLRSLPYVPGGPIVMHDLDPDDFA